MCFSFYFKFVFYFINLKKNWMVVVVGGCMYKKKMKGVNEKFKIYDLYEDDYGWILVYM